jgi:hypothetical protein
MMVVGCLSLLDSDEIGDYSEEIGLTLLAFGAMVFARELRERRRSKQLRGGRYGARGPYKTDRTKEFIDDLIGAESERFFKMWFR